jgi:GNAT superfamily N-acetyltransferase
MKYEALKNGKTVLLREPTMDDVEGSHRFFMDLPPDDRRYLRVDVTKRDLVERRIRDALEGRVHRLVAIADDKIVADGALEFSAEAWRRHIGEIRVIVAHDYQRLSLGAVLIKTLFQAAQQRGMEKVVAKMAAPQTGARRVFERLGFHVDSVLPDYIKDADGKLQSLVVMSCALDDMSKELREFYHDHKTPDG